MSGGFYDHHWNQVAFLMIPAFPDGGAFLVVGDEVRSQFLHEFLGSDTFRLF
jgi:hypothetical protein